MFIYSRMKTKKKVIETTQNDDVEISYDEYDVSVAMPGLHKIRKKVQHIQRPSILPRDLFESYTNKGYEFWRQ